jgi:hypothetical protein
MNRGLFKLTIKSPIITYLLKIFTGIMASSLTGKPSIGGSGRERKETPG